MEADSSTGVAPGPRLSETRQALGLATADVARRLKLSVGQVEALEAGRYHDLPGPIFVRGFIRNYAKLVKLDPDELLQAAGDSLPQAAARPEVPPSQDIPFPNAGPRRWPQFTFGAAVVVGLLAVYEFAVNEAPQTVATRPAEDTPPAKSAPAKKSANAPSPPRSGAPEVTAPIARHAAPVAPSAPAAPAPVQPAAPQPQLQPQPQPQERAATGEEREVRFVFDEESWVEVRDRNDQVIFYQLNAPGTARRVTGLPPLSIVVGNAHGVRMTYAGRPVDLARHTKIDVARVTLQ